MMSFSDRSSQPPHLLSDCQTSHGYIHAVTGLYQPWLQELVVPPPGQQNNLIAGIQNGAELIGPAIRAESLSYFLQCNLAILISLVAPYLGALWRETELERSAG